MARYGAVLHHFGAEELERQAALQAQELRRSEGEYIRPLEQEHPVPRPPPGYNDYFAFDQRVPTGLHGQPDLLLAEATARRGVQAYASPSTGSPAAMPSYASVEPGQYAGVQGHHGATPNTGTTPAGHTESDGSSPRSPSPYYRGATAPQDSSTGYATGSSGSPAGGAEYNARQGHHRPYTAPSRDASPNSGESDADRYYRARARSSYASPKPIVQPPFRSGVPANSPPRRTSAAASGQQAARRSSRRSTGERSRSGSPAGGTTSGEDTAAAAAARPAAERSSGVDDGAGESSDTPPGEATLSPAVAAAVVSSPPDGVVGRSIGRKIAGRPATAHPGGSAAAARRSSARPAVSPRPASAAPMGGGAVAGRERRGSPAVRRRPGAAWSPAAGIQHMQLDEMDEATRVALMLNDPSVRHVVEAQQQQQQHRQAAGAPGASPTPSPQPDGSPPPYLRSRPVSASPGAAVPSTSPRRHAASEASHQYFDQYRLRRHKEGAGVPDYRFSQPRSAGALAALPQRYFTFDEAHPALADQHFARSSTQNAALEAERLAMHRARVRAARASMNKGSPTPSRRALASDVDRLSRVREAGRQRLRQLEEETNTLQVESRQLQQRAMEAIQRSERITANVRARSRSPSASPGRGAGFGSPPPYGGYSPGRYSHGRRSPGRYSPGLSPRDQVYVDALGERIERLQVGADQLAAGQGQGPGQGHGSAAAMGATLADGLGAGPQPHEAARLVDLINQVDRLPQHEQRPLTSDDPQAADEATLEAHISRASSMFSVGRRPGALLNDEEERLATGVYDEQRYAEYQAQVDLEMQRRALSEDYESDMEREEAAGLLVADDDDEARDQRRRSAGEEEELMRGAIRASWAAQDEWMDEYRKRFGPEEGYLVQMASDEGEEGEGQVEGGRGREEGREEESDEDDDGGASEATGTPRRRRGGRRARSATQSEPGRSTASMSPGRALDGPEASVLSNAQQRLVGSPYVPALYSDLPPPYLELAGYSSEGPGGSTGRRFSPTVPEPFTFEERERARPKSIAKVKFEQDIEIRRREEEEARRHQFRASPVPAASLEPRYEEMLLRQEVQRGVNAQQRIQELATQLEQPFSFYYRDRQREAEREAVARAAKDPNRFQTGFRAKDVPQYIKEERFKTMQIELEARREMSRKRVEEAKRRAKERADEEALHRRELADQAYRERLRSVDPRVHEKHPTRPLGALPDFNAMHRQNEIQMARARANMRKRVTVPQEFALNGASPQEKAARARKALERRQAIILDMQLDAEMLPETRWPYRSPRGKVRPTPAPAYLQEHMARNAGTRSAALRKSSAKSPTAHRARNERETAERAVSDKLRAEALKRADRLLKAAATRHQDEQAPAAGGPSDAAATATQDASSSAAANRRRAAIAGREDNPQAYIEARHAQVERRVREEVEDVLLDQGLAAYRYVEGVDGADDAGASSHT